MLCKVCRSIFDGWVQDPEQKQNQAGGWNIVEILIMIVWPIC